MQLIATKAFSTESSTPRITAPSLRLWILFAVALLAAAFYANSIVNGFALDDVGIIETNPTVRELDWTKVWAENYWPVRESPPDILYRPLTIWSYLVNQALTPNATWAFHLTNILLHALVTALVSLLAWRIFRSSSIAFVAGLIFAIHPIHAEVVANTVGRAELLAALWSLLALLVFLPASNISKLDVPPRHWAHGLLVAACFLLAMLSKETPVALIGAMGFIDLWRWAQTPRADRPSFFRYFAGRSLRYYLPLLLAFGIYLALRMHGTDLLRDIRGVHPIVNPLVGAGLAERLLTPFMLLAKYLELMVWPATLSADYSAPSIMPSANIFHPMILAGMLITALGALLTIATWKRRPQVALILVLFVSSYVLVANYLRIGTIFGERLFYWPSVFVTILAAAGICALWQYAAEIRFRTALRASTAALLIAASIAMSVRTYLRNQDWQDNIALAISTARDNPQSAKACQWAGITLLSQAQEPWMKNFGLELLHRAIELYPTFGDSYWEIAKYEGRQGNLNKSVQYLAEAARYRGGAVDIRIALSAVKSDIAVHPEAELLAHMNARLAENPQDPTRHLAKGLVLAGHSHFKEAVAAMDQALALDPAFHEAAAELGMAHLAAGDKITGVAILRKYVMQVRNNVEARCQLARALMELDPQEFPTALAEAAMNVDRAEQLGNGDSRVRSLRAELQRKKQARETPPILKVADNRLLSQPGR